MAGPTYYDVANGKPFSSVERVVDGRNVRTDTIDLLWRYNFDWLVFDRWTASEIDVPVPNTQVDAPEIAIEFSNDGTNYLQSEVTHGIISSDKGSLGTHRSIRTIFEAPGNGRYIRISYETSRWTYKIRAILLLRQAIVQEQSKLVENLPLDYLPSLEGLPVRASILGDSNSVKRYGWVKGIPLGGVEIVENVSLGSSSNSIHATQLQNLKNTDIDVLYVQTTVNEYTPMRDRIYDANLSRQMIRHVQSWAAKYDVVPIYVIMPHRRAIDDIAAGLTPFDHEAYCIEVCEELRIPYVNGFALVREISAAWGRDESSLFSDPAHLNHPAAQALGAAIGARTKDFLQNEWEPKHGHSSSEILTHEFQVLQLGDEAIVSRGYLGRRQLVTSLVNQEMIELRGDSKVYVPVPSGWEVVAFTANARSCNASIRIQGENKVLRRADFTGYQGLEGSAFVCVRSLIHPVRPANGGVTISCARPTSAHERDEVTHKVAPEIAVGALHLEISQLIIRRIARTEPYLRVMEVPLNLTKSMSMNFLSRNPGPLLDFQDTVKPPA